MNEFVKIKADLEDAAKKNIRKLLKLYKTNQDDMLEEVAAVILKNQDDSGFVIATPSMLAELRKNIKGNLNGLNKAERTLFDDLLSENYIAAAKQTADKLGVAKFMVDWKITRDEFVRRAINSPIDGKNYSSRIWENKTELANRVYSDILDIVRTGKRPEEIARRIKNDFGASAYQAKRLVNTELAKVVSDAQLEVYARSGVVQKVMWTATLEENTCENCAGLDGKEFDIDKAPRLPMHPNCRCCFVPVVDRWSPTRRADNTTKTNIDYMTFGRWSSGK